MGTKAIANTPTAKRTAFEDAKSAKERLEITGGKRVELRPVHPSDVEEKKKQFIKENGFKATDVNFTYNEGGMSLVATW